jgi:hypothetical protein
MYSVLFALIPLYRRLIPTDDTTRKYEICYDIAKDDLPSIGDEFIEVKIGALMVMSIHAYLSEHDELIDRKPVYNPHSRTLQAIFIEPHSFLLDMGQDMGGTCFW